ncbi:MAG: hypothetical protein M3337_03120 [Actinomycetota bacterium]|nr:hypothetical protein [Actinomycetota bacterium]
MDVDYLEPSFASVDEMASASDLVVTGEVTSIRSLGRRDTAEDQNASEYVAVVVGIDEIIKGDGDSEVILAWEAYVTDGDGTRAYEMVANGVRVPRQGDRMLLFLTPQEPALIDRFDGVPTHRLIRLEGAAYLEDDTIVAGSHDPLTEQLLDMTIDDIRAVVSS